MSNNIPNISMVGCLWAGFLLTYPSASFTVPTTQEMSIEGHLKEDSWVQPTTKPCEYTIKDDLKHTLQLIKTDFLAEHNQQLLPETLNNAFHVLSKIVDEGLVIPYIAANGQGEIGLTWDTSKHRIYLAIDGFNRLFLSIVNRKKIDEYDCSQRTIKEDNEILSKIREVL